MQAAEVAAGQLGLGVEREGFRGDLRLLLLYRIELLTVQDQPLRRLFVVMLQTCDQVGIDGSQEPRTVSSCG